MCEDFSREKYIQELEKKLEVYEKKEEAVRKAIKQGKEVLGITGKESGPEIIAKILPSVLTGNTSKFSFLNELLFVFKDEIQM